MKKLLVLAAVIVAGIAANAASFKWTGANVYGPDGNKFTGTALLYCDALSSESLASTAVANGALTAKTFDVDSAVADTSYDFYFVISTEYDSKEVTFTSPTKAATASETGTVGISFGNMQSASTASGAWSTAAVPEPTSGLLMLLGIAGLALRRRRA